MIQSQTLLFVAVYLVALTSVVFLVTLNVYKMKKKSERSLFIAAFVLIVSGSAVTSLLVSLKPKIDSVVTESQAKVNELREELGVYKSEERIPVALEQEFSQAITNNDDAQRFQILVWFLVIFLNVIGFGVAANLYSKAITDVPTTSEVYEIPKELYKRMERLEAKQSVAQGLIAFLIVIFVIKWIFSP